MDIQEHFILILDVNARVAVALNICPIRLLSIHHLVNTHEIIRRVRVKLGMIYREIGLSSQLLTALDCLVNLILKCSLPPWW